MCIQTVAAVRAKHVKSFAAALRRKNASMQYTRLAQIHVSLRPAILAVAYDILMMNFFKVKLYCFTINVIIA